MANAQITINTPSLTVARSASSTFSFSIKAPTASGGDLREVVKMSEYDISRGFHIYESEIIDTSTFEGFKGFEVI
jgi:hypothetical protein